MQNQNRQSGLEIREGIFDNVPHVIIGKQNSQPIQKAPPIKPPNNPGNYKQPNYYPKPQEDLIDKMKRWALIFFTILILCVAGYGVLKVILGRFF